MAGQTDDNILHFRRHILDCSTADDHSTEEWDVEKARDLFYEFADQTRPEQTRVDKKGEIMSRFTVTVSSRQILFHAISGL